jgi:phosphate transport system substrate-binding protein
MPERHAPWQGRTLGTLGLLILAACALSACAVLLRPQAEREGEPGEGSGQSGPPLVRLAVCWAALPLAEDLAAAYVAVDPGLSVDIVPSNSRVVAGLVTAGQADLAIVDQEPGVTPLPEADEDSHRSSGMRVLALDTTAVIVHKDLPLTQLAATDLAALYAGHRLDWEELQAGKGRIEVVSQEEGSEVRRLFEGAILGGSPASSAAVVVPHDRGALDYVAQHPDAIAYVSTAYVDERVKVVAIDGVLPTRAEVERGRYPLAHPLVLLTAAHAPAEALRLAAFALSNKGQQAISRRYVLSR